MPFLWPGTCVALEEPEGISLWGSITTSNSHDMKNLFLLASILSLGILGLQDVSTAHGGTWRGPGDTVPPGGGSGRGGGGKTPGPSGPRSPDPQGPDTPTPGGPHHGGNGRSSGPVTPGGAAGTDRTQWQFWWGFNRDPYLNLKHHIHGPRTVTGSDDFYLGFGQREGLRETLAPSEQTIREKIVPALLQALRTETSNDIVTGSMIALAKIGDDPKESGESEFQSVIEEFLDDPNQEIAETAAVSLGILGNPQSVEVLRSLAMDSPQGRRLVGEESGVNIRTRSFATFGLGQIGNRCGDVEVRQEIVELLWSICESPRGRTRDLKVSAVVAMGLVPLELEASGDVRHRTAELSARAPRSREEQVLYLLDFFSDEKDKSKPELVRSHAPRAIVRLLESVDTIGLKQRVVEALAPYVDKRGNGGVKALRQSASLAFGMLGDLDLDPADQTIRKCLGEAIGNADVMVKHFSVLALGQVGGRPGEGQEPGAAIAEVRKVLANQLTRGKSSLEPWAALAIGVMERGQRDHDQEPSQEALRNLRLLLSKERSPSDAGAFAIALGIAGDLESEEVLLERLENMSEDEVRGHLAIGLGLMGSKQAREAIQEVVANSKYRGELLKQAAVALGLLGDGRLVTQLVAMLEEAKTLTTQAAVASALGFIGDRQSVVPLIEMLQDKGITERARGFGAVALGIVADKEPLPWNAKFAVDCNYLANTVTLTSPLGTGVLDIL
jgi:HEAT repeat protein